MMLWHVPAAGVRHWRGVGVRLALPHAGVGLGPRLGAAVGLVLGGPRQLQHRGESQAATVHYRLLSATFWRLPGKNSVVYDKQTL